MAHYNYDYTNAGQTQKVQDALVDLERCYEADQAALKAAKASFEKGDFAEALQALRRPRGVDGIKRGAAEQRLQEGLELLKRPA